MRRLYLAADDLLAFQSLTHHSCQISPGAVSTNGNLVPINTVIVTTKK